MDLHNQILFHVLSEKQVQFLETVKNTNLKIF